MRKLEGASLRTYTIRVGVKVQTIWTQFKRSILIISSLSLMLSTLSFLGQTAQAAQITSRSVTISSAVESASATYTVSFTPGTAGVIQSLTLQACTSAVGTCTAPTGLNIQAGTASLTGATWQGTITSPSQNTTSTTPIDCTLTNDYCYSWTDGTSQNNTSAHTLTITGVTNPNVLGTFYIRILTYSGAYTGLVDNGNVAAATTQTFTTSAIVQEQLIFCVGAVNGDSSTVEVTGYALPTCTTLGGSSLSLGTLNSSQVSVSPMPTTQPSNGDLNNAVAELTTNAANGSVVTYNAIAQGSGPHDASLKVGSATCNSGSSFTDQCINSVSPAGPITAGTEDFGMTVTGINCHNVVVTAYTCDATHHNLNLDPSYDCNSTNASTAFTSFDTGGQENGPTTCNFAWDDSGGSNTVASSSSVVAGEGMIIEFAATPELTTPTGTYTALANFVATPTY